MAQSNLKFSWGAEDSLPSNIINGKAYFATLNQYPLTSNTKAPEAFLYFDKDNVRYNVIAKRAISDVLGNNIVNKYATKIMSSNNTMSIYAPGQDNLNNTLLGTANIINSLSIGTGTTHNGSTYHLHININDVISADYALAAANDSLAGIVTTGAQSFSGIKTFVNNTESTSTTTGAVIVTGGVGIGGAINAGGSIAAATTLSVGSNASIGGDLAVTGDLTIEGRDIYLGNEDSGIVTLSSNAASNVVSLGNSNSTTFGLRLYNHNLNPNANYIELDRGTDSSWKIVNDDNFRIQNNYSTILEEDYFDIFTLAHNTGNATLKGNLQADTITITNTNGVGHLKFSRTSTSNYITAPLGGYISFVVNGQSVELENSDLIIADRYVYPGADILTSLGKSNRNFSEVHVRHVASADSLAISAAASKAITFRQNTTEVGSFDTTGSLKVTKSIYPAVNNSANSTLGKSTLYWNHTYSTNFTGTNFNGTTFAGTNFNGTTFTGTNFNGTTFTGGTVYATTVGVYAGTSVSDRATFTYDKSTDTLTLTFA